MAELGTGEQLRNRRISAGLSQRQLAQLSGLPQPNIAAYERDRRAPSMETLRRLDEALRVPTMEGVRAVRAAILRAAEQRRLSDVRVFGSVARGQASAGSDLDLLVHPDAETSVFDLAAFMADVEEQLGIDVDVVSDRGTGPIMERIRAEAVAL